MPAACMVAQQSTDTRFLFYQHVWLPNNRALIPDFCFTNMYGCPTTEHWHQIFVLPACMVAQQQSTDTRFLFYLHVWLPNRAPTPDFCGKTFGCWNSMNMLIQFSLHIVVSGLSCTKLIHFSPSTYATKPLKTDPPNGHMPRSFNCVCYNWRPIFGGTVV